MLWVKSGVTVTVSSGVSPTMILLADDRLPLTVILPLPEPCTCRLPVIRVSASNQTRPVPLGSSLILLFEMLLITLPSRIK